ncbi:hypothetical protein [Gimesia aquarii]|uniref:Haloacid dehalogenase-like hydrolase n=1 Tax=Gimesia aquarii TaxID=2527964 RepID=A0A517WNN0_9PLAN|nr:hypothetical protein [Gimesia aquarii]QDU06857.1 hypothetical protein V202x_02000 [Gimesia aquarii]
MSHRLLPLWNKVVFVDWHGVLSRDPFWISILQNPQHPLHQQLSGAVKCLFTQNEGLIHDWMRGNVKANKVIDSMEIVLDKRFHSDYLARRLVDDCRLMHSDARMHKILQEAQNGALIVLATDNMDCFFEQIQRVKCRRTSRHKLNPVFKEALPTFASTVKLFDDVLCSSKLGVLKREKPMRFFGDWLHKRSLDFQNALLLDDTEENCIAFRSAGGTALHITAKSKELSSIQFKLQSWLQDEI